MNYRDGVALITGASAGIGAAFARALAGKGMRLILVARREDRLQALNAELGGAHEVFRADLGDAADLHRLEERISSEPNLRLLVNNAGFGIAGRFTATSADDHERMHRVHVIATLRLCHAALRNFERSGQGAMVNVSSVAGFTLSPGSVSYSATKHWMNTFTESLYLDLQARRSPVRIQALCPGFTLSEFHDVMPMDRSVIPSGWWCNAGDVVNASLDGLERNKLFVVPGWRYRALISLVRVIPSGLMRAGSLFMARRMKRV